MASHVIPAPTTFQYASRCCCTRAGAEPPVLRTCADSGSGTRAAVEEQEPPDVNMYRAGISARRRSGIFLPAGWSAGHDEEFSADEKLVEGFRLKREPTNAVFDRAKLEWFNTRICRSAYRRTAAHVEGE